VAYGDSHMMSWLPFVWHFAERINATEIMAVQSQAMPARFVTQRTPLVHGYPLGIENCQSMIIFYSQYNDYMLSAKKPSEIAADTLNIINFWSKKGTLVIIEDIPSNASADSKVDRNSCLGDWVEEQRRRLDSLSNLRDAETANNLTKYNRERIIDEGECSFKRENPRTFGDMIEENRWDLKNTVYIDYNELVCGGHGDMCPVNVGTIPIYRDADHLSVEFVEAAASTLTLKLIQALSLAPTKTNAPTKTPTKFQRTKISAHI